MCGDCPVKVSDVAILFDTESKKRVLQMTFSNEGDKSVLGVYIKVICYDRYGNIIPYRGKDCRLWSFSTLSLPAFADDSEIFEGVKKLVNLDSDDIVDCDIFVTKIFFIGSGSVSFSEDDYVSSFRKKQDEKKKQRADNSVSEDGSRKKTKKLISLIIIGVVLIYAAVSLSVFFFNRIVVPGRIENQINSYVDSGDFDDALLYAKEKGRDDLHNMIVSKASEHYFEIKDYDNAVKYAALSYDSNVKTDAYINAVQLLSDEADFDKALELAHQSGIESLEGDTEKLAVEYYRKAGDYLKASGYISDERRDSYSDFYTEAAGKLLESGDEKTALHFGLLSGKKEDWLSLYNKVVLELVEKKDFEAAALLICDSGRTTTDTVTKELAKAVFESLDDSFIRSNLKSVFSQLSLEKKISFNANLLDIETDAVAVNGDRKVEATNEIFAWSDVASVRTSGNHTVCVKKDGAVAAKGDNTYRQCDISGLKNIIDIGAGEFHTVVLKNDGTAAAVGYNSFGQCNVGEFSDIVSVAAGKNHTVLLRSDGTVAAVGDNSLGQCDVSEFCDIVAIAAGDNFTVGLKSDGKLVAAGDNSRGQCSVASAKDVVKIAAGGDMTACILSDRTVSVFGGEGIDASGIKNAVLVAAGKQSIAVLTENGTVTALGNGAPDTSGLKNIGRAE